MNKFKLFAVITIAILGLGSVLAIGLDNARLLRQPDVHGNKIVFRYADDLWIVSTEGGLARRLTSHPGTEHSPSFSPDGKWIAFSANYDGNEDVYVIPAEGGTPKRLTYHPFGDDVTGWTNDGKSILFTSTRNLNSRKMRRLYSVPVEGGFPQMYPIYKAYWADMSADGNYLAYSPTAVAYTSWRRYRGGRTQNVWILNLKDYSVKEIKQEKPWNDSYPQWIGTDIYFMSDRDRIMNLYKYDTKTDKTTQLTKFKDNDIKTFGLCKKNVVFEQNGYLHLLNPADGKAKQLKIDIPAEQLETRPRFVKAGNLIFNSDISPNGKRAVFEARGEIVTVPAEKGDIRDISRTPCKAERTPKWSPDGKWIAYYGEDKGEYVLKIVDQKGIKEPKIITIPEPTYFYSLDWSPDSKKIAFIDLKQKLYYVNIADKKITTVAEEEFALSYPSHAWSPDSKWIAYTKSMANRMKAVFLYSLDTKKSTPVTDAMAFAEDPVFDKSGKYLYFSASTNMAQDLAWLDMTSTVNHPTSELYLIVLDKNEPSPFKPESDEEVVKKDKKDSKKKDKKKKEEKITKIDLDGITGRIVPISMPRGSYGNLQAGSANQLYFTSFDDRTFNADLHLYKIDKKKSENILSGVRSYRIAENGKKILYSTRNGTWAITNAGGKIKPGDGTLKTSQIEVWAVPKLEWKQMLHEAWRFNRDWFYDPGMHGRDWPAVWKKYESYLPYVAHRSDLTYLIAQLIGELTVGHAYVGGGMYPEVDRVPGGLLGADYEVENGYYKIKYIYAGENWNPRLRSPLTEPAVNVKTGDYILEVNGRSLKAPMNIHSLFLNTADKQVTLKVNSKPEMKGARTVTVVPIANDSFLRHKDWLENNRKLVNKLTDGKIGYVYLPDTHMGGFTNFNRYYFAQLEKDGIIIDERYNSGGKVADYIVNNMNFDILNWWQPRYGKPFATPGATNFGAKVMIIDEMAGSGGDYMPFAFRARNVGKLIGKRTWGGLVGISGYPPLMDGGYVTAPSFGIVSVDGEFIIENAGVSPDIEVDIYPADFKAGKDTQLLRAIKEIMKEIKDQKLPELKFESFPRGR